MLWCSTRSANLKEYCQRFGEHEECAKVARLHFHVDKLIGIFNEPAGVFVLFEMLGIFSLKVYMDLIDCIVASGVWFLEESPQCSQKASKKYIHINHYYTH